jgi:hypothetical protein
MTNLSNFIRDIDEYIFKKELIYRSIIITNNLKEGVFLKNKLELNDYNILLLENIDTSINYNDINNRIVIITYHMFKEFIDHLDNYNGGILNSTYNFIGFYYDINYNITKELISYYILKTNNNINKTIILDKDYANFLSLKQSIL